MHLAVEFCKCLTLVRSLLLLLGPVARYSCTSVQGLADARKRARRSGLVQFFAVYQFDRGGILQMCHTVGELCNHAVRGSMVWRQTSDTICEFTVNSVF